MAELGRLLIYEATADWLPTVNGQVEAPFGIADCSFVDPDRPIKASLGQGLSLICKFLHAYGRNILTFQEMLHVHHLLSFTLLACSLVARFQFSSHDA